MNVMPRLLGKVPGISDFVGKMKSYCATRYLGGNDLTRDRWGDPVGRTPERHTVGAVSAVAGVPRRLVSI